MRTDNGPTGRKPSFIEAARRAQVVEAATRTVAELGYTGASLARIAQDAGISKSVISYHFNSKEDLLEQVVNEVFDRIWTFMEPRIAATESAPAAIRVWAESQLTYVATHRSDFLAMSEIVANHRRADGTRPFDGAEREEVDELARILAAGQRAGEIRDVDAMAVAMMISDTLAGTLGRWAFDETSDLTARIPVLIDFIDHAIREEKP